MHPAPPPYNKELSGPDMSMVLMLGNNGLGGIILELDDEVVYRQTKPISLTLKEQCFQMCLLCFLALHIS